MDLTFNKNEDAMKLAYSQVRQKLDDIFEGGGKKAIQKQKERGKLTARERITYLCDQSSNFVEIGAFAGYDMYADHGGCPAGGTVSGVGYISGRQCVIVANDQTVKAGAWFPITGKKNLRLCKRRFLRINILNYYFASTITQSCGMSQQFLLFKVLDLFCINQSSINH